MRTSTPLKSPIMECLCGRHDDWPTRSIGLESGASISITFDRGQYFKPALENPCAIPPAPANSSRQVPLGRSA